MNEVRTNHGVVDQSVRWRVLVATESLVDQRLVVGLLSKCGHSVDTASNGKDALQKSESCEFDIVLVDQYLPEFDGLELSRLIRLNEKARGKRCAIFAMCEEDVGARDQCQEAGIDSLVEKPFRIEQLLECMGTLNGISSPRSCENQDLQESTVVDWKVAVEAVGGRRELLQELIDLFFTEYPPTLDAIRQAIQDRNAKALQLSAHKLKGCLRYFGHTPASNRAKELEDLGRAGNIESAAAKLPRFEEALSQLLPLLRDVPQLG